MSDNKIILLIGRSGRGKSTLANVVTSTNDFKESTGSVSETRKIQLGEFAENDLNYQIIDTPGIGDTKLKENEVLDIIAEAVYRAKDGVGQVFFVTNGRFDQYEMATYDLLRTIIFDKDIAKHTTIVRTRFPEFRDKGKCEEDINLMAKEAQEKKVELEQDLEKENLTTTNLAEIIKSCNKVIHVDNPSLDVDDEEELEIGKEDRDKSREILLEHLNKSCQESPYRPEKLTQLSEAIANDYFEYLQKKEELEKELELERLKSKETKPISSQSSRIENKFENISSENNKLGPEEKQKESESNAEIIKTKEL